MKNIIINIGLALLIAVSAFTVNAQDLYMTNAYQNAIDNGTRTLTGIPGDNYFQNRAVYDIKIAFNPSVSEIVGSETIEYKNNSNINLSIIVIRLYQDLYKKGNSRNAKVDMQDVHSGVVINKLVIGGQEFFPEQYKSNHRGTNLFIKLNKKIEPQSITKIKIDWQVSYPEKTQLRGGKYGDNTYFLAYWYPRISVYDDIDGWNWHSHNGEQEFYNDFSDYTVSLTLPKDILAWSSGELQNPQQVYSPQLFKKWENSRISDKVVNLVDTNSINNGGLTIDKPKLTWVFTAANITDFAIAISDNYLWDIVSLPTSNGRVTINAVFNRKSMDFNEVAQIGKNAIKLLADSVFGVPYPYKHMTVFNGHSGMEFPAMVNDGDADNRNSTIFVTAHEIAHTYFPFLVGVNEQQNAWIDEGLVTFMPKEVEQKLSDDDNYNPMKSNIATYSRLAGSKFDLPLMVPSSQLTGTSYFFQAYSRSAVAFSVLEDYLGKGLYKKCITEFINRWKGKHPSPYDLFYTFNDVSGQNLNWFWKPWFFEFGYPDLGIGDIEQNKNSTTIDIDKIGNIPIPVEIVITYLDNSTETIKKPISVWKNSNSYRVVLKNTKEIKSITLGNPMIPDAVNKNNSVELKKPED